MRYVEIVGIFICCGLSTFATGNSAQEAYNRYRKVAENAGITPLQIDECSIYFADQCSIFC